MLDKFLNKMNNVSVKDSFSEQVENYNNQVIKEIERKAKENPVNTSRINVSEQFHLKKFSNFQKSGENFLPERKQRPNTYQVPKKEVKTKEYIDDGSYFCSYSVGGNTLVCYKNKEKIEIILDGITHPDKNHYLAKRANYFLNDLVKKQKIFIIEKENGYYEAFLDAKKTESINSMLISEGYHNSEPYDNTLKNKKTTFSKNNSDMKEKEDNVAEKFEVKEKKNYAYGLFATNHNTFEALFNKEKITLRIDGIDSISKENQKICKSMIYDFVSKKIIILNFIKEENGIYFVEVFNKDGESLNQLISAKNFIPEPTIKNENEAVSSEDTDEIHTENDNLSSNEEYLLTEDSPTIDSVEIPEITHLSGMFKKPLSSNPDSPFAKKKNQSIINNIETEFINNIEDESHDSFDLLNGEEINVPEVINLPTMFKKTVSSNPDSPFSKKKNQQIINIETESINNIKEESDDFFDFLNVGEINVPEIINLPTMFKKTVSSNPDSPFSKKKNQDAANSEKMENSSTVSEIEVPIKKKLSFGKR